MKKRMLLMGLCLFAAVVMAACLLPVTAQGAEAGYCQGCQTEITDWIAIGGEQLQTLSIEPGKHYYLTQDLTGTPDGGVLLSGGGCVELNGFNITAGSGCVAISCGAGTTNLMGSGTVSGSCASASTGATVHTADSAVVHLYGGTYTKSGNNSAIYVGKSSKVYMHDGARIDTAGTFATYPTAVFMEKSSGLFHMYGGTIIGGTTTGNGGSIRVSNGSFIIDGGTVSGGQADRGGNIAVNSSGKLTVNGGTITSGTATATYGGGNIYTNKRAVTVNGGLITQGVAQGSSYGGGNIGIYRATFTINGGTISDGKAVDGTSCIGGGNIYAEGDIAKLTITDGLITGGTTLGSGGNICCKFGTLNIQGGTISDGSTGADTLGGGNIYFVDTAVTVTGGNITGGTTTVNGGNILASGSLVIDGGTLSGGKAARGGNIAVREGGSLTVNGGTITSGTATATYGGGNIFTNKCPVTVNDGLITQGVAQGSSYGGGNIGIYKCTVNICGGTISDGRATNESCYGGGNIYMEGGNAVLNMTGGLVTGGYIATGHGHSIYGRSGKMHFGSDARVTNKAEGTGGSMNVYLYNGVMESAGSFTGGMWVNDGTVSITGGKYYSFYYKGTDTCTITGGLFRVNYSQYVPQGYRWVVIAASDSYIYTVLPEAEVPEVVLVDGAGKEAYTDDPLTQFSTDRYAYIKLYGDLDLGALSDQVLWIDINGNNLTVSGSGKLYAFDSANDGYDAAACGAVTNNGSVEIAQDVHAPNGKRYIALTDSTTTLHRLHMGLTNVTLRPSQAGIYYKSTYYCDDVLSSKVLKYGIVLSLNNMPGGDFLTEQGETNLYTQARQPFQSGVQVKSAGVFGIMKQIWSAKSNMAYSKMPIYANPYIQLDLNGGSICMADEQNPGKVKTDGDFTGVAYSLYDVMEAVDGIYADCSQDQQSLVDGFYFTWKNLGINWSFNNIGKSYTSDLTVADGQGYCMVCQKTVSWTALDQATYASVPYGVAANGAHVYLEEDLTYTGTEGNGFLIAPATANHTVCLHLNGHNLTATNSRALYGNYGVLNVLGSGTVAGYVNGAKYGAAVQISTTGSKGVINLYSGTYCHAPNAAAGSYAVGIRNSGGRINIYEDAYIDGGQLGKAIITGTSNSVNSTVGLYNTSVNGEVYLTGSTPKITKLIVENTHINGTVDVNGVSTVILRGKTVISGLDVESSSLVTLDGLTEGTQITVYADGQFTQAHTDTATWAKYFQPGRTGNKIQVQDNALYCLADYTAALELTDTGSGYCRVCQKTVDWTALDSTAPVVLAEGQHLYLTGCVSYEGAEAFLTASGGCLHLNGYDIAAANGVAIYCNAALNILGSGTVTGRGAVVAADGAAIKLFSGTYSSSDPAVAAAACADSGGTLELYPDAVCQGDYAICTGTCQGGAASLYIKGASIQGAVVLTSPVGEYPCHAAIESAKITSLQVGSGVDVSLKGRPRISDLTVAQGTLVTLTGLVQGTDVTVSAEGCFTASGSLVRTWADYFTAKDPSKWIVVQEKALSCVERASLPNGNKILVVGNSMTYYGKYVIDKGHVLPLTTRVNDQGYLYQVCTANGVDVSITNFTFGGHTLKDFYSGKCAADRGHNGHNHLEDLTDRNYDYVIFQEGSEAADNENILEQCQPLMDLFLAENPNTKFLFLVQSTAHTENNLWRTSLKELEENGVTVVDWGGMVYDLINGTVTVPGGTQSYSKFSFVVNKSAKDGRHPNILAGYIAAQMTYCAITGESAVGNDYSFWNDNRANSAFLLSSYKSVYYSYDSTVPSNTNFEAIFASYTDMNGLHMLIDQYLKEKSFMDY